ncbi:alpha/beta hydrolase [Aeromicrobium sp. A1-2]|uniref:alpha/beta fold hydrolase n=1 Tax=Aeromicrobium sp. A1-2 TaxID=2107713 RepID=UPI000E5464CC|nr:alpha/beta hydrolase [Aeromicrobium sp. A1-2]AXT84923.1 alpha/beta hydrolase [Aeromicrobium sp. A1-2]
MDAASRHHVTRTGVSGGPSLVFAHGFGCDQHMWRHVAPAFEDEFDVICFDHVGAGASDLSAYDPHRYADLSAYAHDVVELCRELDTRDTIFVGHSVSAMVGVLADISQPGLFSGLLLVGPSACYVDHPEDDYVGGFSERDIEELLAVIDDNYLGWSSTMAPLIMANPEQPELGQELTESFCRTDPEIARQFARVTFTSDNRADLPQVSAPTLVMQCRDDAIAPLGAGRLVHESIPDSTFVQMNATGHIPHLSAPQETIAAMTAFLHRA